MERQKKEDAAEPDVPKGHGGMPEERPQRRGTAKVANLVELIAQETAMSRHPTQVLLVEDSRVQSSSNEREDEIAKATEKKLREDMLVSNIVNGSSVTSSDAINSKVSVPFSSIDINGEKKVIEKADNVQEKPVISNNTGRGRRVSAIMQNLAELAPDTLESQPSDCLIVEDTRLTRTTGDEELKAKESRHRAALLTTKSPPSRRDDDKPTLMEDDRILVLDAAERDLKIKTREKSTAGLSRPLPVYPGMDSKSVYGRQVATAGNPLPDTAIPGLVHIPEPSSQEFIPDGMTPSAPPVYRLQHGPNGASGNEESNLNKSDKGFDNPYMSHDMIDNGLIGAFFVAPDGTRVMRAKVNLPTQPDIPADSQLNTSGWQRLASDEELPPSPDVDEAPKPPGSEGMPTCSSCCTTKLKVLVLLVVVCAIAVAIAVPLSHRTPSPSTPPSSSKSTPTLKRQQMVRSIISNKAIDDTSSPQHMAFNWIVQTDQLSPVNDTSSAQETQKIVTRYSLATFYYGLGGDKWFRRNSWLNGQQDECSWQFVNCSTSNTVQSILIGSNNMEGSVPSEVQYLSSLHALDLSKNAISGIPGELRNLTELDSLYLQSNKLNGPFPTMLYQLTTLVNLNLGSNLFQGSLPSDVSRLSNLQSFLIGSNKLTGSITSQFQTMTALQNLELISNRFSGNWQEVTRGLLNLTWIDFTDNAFGGSLDGIEKYEHLGKFYFSKNNLTGTIPTELGLITTLGDLELDQNKLRGTIPSELGKLTKLSYLSLYGNSALTGSVPQSFCQIAGLDNIIIDKAIHCNCSSCRNG